MLEGFEVQLLGSDEGEDTAGGSNHDVWAVRLQGLFVFLDVKSSKEYSNLK